jgi:hypothetical membrane protein
MRDKINITKFKITRVAGICGILIPIVIFISLSLAMSDSPWFRWTHNALSDLGVEGLSAFFFNNGIILGGLLAFVFSIGLAKRLSKKTGAYILAASSLGLIGAGLFPKTVFILHYISSAAFFVLLTLALFIIGITMRRDQFEKKLGIVAIVFALFACSSPVFQNFLNGIAIPEAIVCFPAFLWCMIYGVKMTIKTQPEGTLYDHKHS